MILIRMNKQCRCFRILSIFQRRVFPQNIKCKWRRCSTLIWIKVRANITHKTLRNPVRDTSLTHCTTETIRMANDPVCHKTTIGATRFTNSIWINCWKVLQYCICKIHQILVVNITIQSTNIRKRITSSIRASYICKEYKVSFTRPDLHFMEERFPIRSSRSTMNIKYCRIFLTRIIIHW